MTYDGPARLVTDGTDGTDDSGVDVEVRLRGAFQPIDGRFHWYGRIAQHDAIDALVAAGCARVVLRTPHGDAPGRLSDRDPWGRYRVGGTGHPPYAL